MAVTVRLFLLVGAIVALGLLHHAEGSSSGDTLIDVKHVPYLCPNTVQEGDTVFVAYDIRVLNPETGTPGDTIAKSDPSEPISFKLGVNHIIQGWHDGILGMCAGEIRTLTIPASRAYGSEGSKPDIPPNATLVCEIELRAIDELTLSTTKIVMYGFMALLSLATITTAVLFYTRWMARGGVRKSEEESHLLHDRHPSHEKDV